MEGPMLNRFARAMVFVALISATVLLAQSGDSANQNRYHEGPPTGLLPVTLDPVSFVEDKSAFVAYSIASKIRALLYQQPCYCGCDKFANHKSLLDCYTAKHGVSCHVCQKEVFFTYEQSKTGKTMAQIREAMEKGDYLKFDREHYVEANYAQYKQPAP
jgi:hypothetical protein